MRTGYRILLRTLLVAFLGVFASACPTTDPVTTCDPTNDSPCFEGYACDPDSRHCRRACTDSGDCLGSETCDTVVGICKDGDRTGDSNAGGDPSGGDDAGGDTN